MRKVIAGTLLVVLVVNPAAAIAAFFALICVAAIAVTGYAIAYNFTDRARGK